MIGSIINLYKKMEAFLENFSYSLWNIGLTVETYRYPEKRVKVYGDKYGALRLKPKVDKNRHRCEICLECEKACPNNAITIHTYRASETKLILLSFNHNLSFCTNCGECIKSCSYEAIEFNQDYGISISDSKDLTFDILKRFREKPL